MTPYNHALSELLLAQDARDREQPHSPRWIAADAVVAHWARRLDESEVPA